MRGRAYTWSNTRVKEKVGLSAEGPICAGGRAYRRRNTLYNFARLSKLGLIHIETLGTSLPYIKLFQQSGGGRRGEGEGDYGITSQPETTRQI